VHTPECKSTDLTQLIRQEKAWLDVPVVLISDSNDALEWRNAMRAGVDDVLERPTDENLIFSLSGRIERHRALRSLIARDGLTGLYNHSAITEHLIREVARSQREGLPLSLVMLDIDFFKRVNDTYGHPVGDQVIRALARLLQHRLRHSDLIGRYGGEEFSVILPATSASAGLQVMDTIRNVFQEIRHKTGNQEFAVSFSAGIADLSHARDASSLFRVADAALYRAKHGGRNRIEIATDEHSNNMPLPADEQRQ
jgi:diguanylate cyclase (GGDEF)-like protein